MTLSRGCRRTTFVRLEVPYYVTFERFSTFVMADITLSKVGYTLIEIYFVG